MYLWSWVWLLTWGPRSSVRLNYPLQAGTNLDLHQSNELKRKTVCLLVLPPGEWTLYGPVGFGGWFWEESMVQQKDFCFAYFIHRYDHVSCLCRVLVVRVRLGASLILVISHCKSFAIWICSCKHTNCKRASLLRLSFCIRLTGMVLRALCIWKPDLLLFIGKLFKA